MSYKHAGWLCRYEGNAEGILQSDATHDYWKHDDKKHTNCEEVFVLVEE